MRILLLSAIILSSFYLFRPSEPEGEEIDDVKMRLSAPARKERKPARALTRQAQLLDSQIEVEAETPELADVEARSDIDSDESISSESELEHVEETPVDDHEKSWQDELSQIILNLEPEYGEEMFNAYVSERNNFQSTLDELIRNNQKNQDLEILIGELETKHEEQVKEIFGRHYEDIREQQVKFLESESP